MYMITNIRCPPRCTIRHIMITITANVKHTHTNTRTHAPTHPHNNPHIHDSLAHKPPPPPRTHTHTHTHHPAPSQSVSGESCTKEVSCEVRLERLHAERLTDEFGSEESSKTEGSWYWKDLAPTLFSSLYVGHTADFLRRIGGICEESMERDDQRGRGGAMYYQSSGKQV